MPNGVKFPGQVLSIWLDNQAYRERLVRILQLKYKGQMGFSSYGKLAIYRMLEEDEKITANGKQNDEHDKVEEGRGALPTKLSASDINRTLTRRTAPTTQESATDES